jgi:hypothetical protein
MLSVELRYKTYSVERFFEKKAELERRGWWMFMGGGDENTAGGVFYRDVKKAWWPPAPRLQPSAAPLQELVEGVARMVGAAPNLTQQEQP